MIADYYRYYGCVFTQLVERRPRLVIERMSVNIQGVYLIDKSIPLYIKFSRNRRGPWAFTFQAEHQLCCERLAKRFGNSITALVCGTDGIAALDNHELRSVLDGKFDDQEGIVVRRKLRHMYSVTGKNGKLAHKVGRESLVATVERLAA
jgi:hypothetical protein